MATIKELYGKDPIDIDGRKDKICDILQMGDVIEFPYKKGKDVVKVFFLDYKETRSVDWCGENLPNYDKWQIKETLVEYWKTYNDLDIEEPEFTLQCIHFPQGTRIFNFPSTAVLSITKNTVTRKVIEDIGLQIQKDIEESTMCHQGHYSLASISMEENTFGEIRKEKCKMCHMKNNNRSVKCFAYLVDDFISM
jgi:hypothetical protein